MKLRAHKNQCERRRHRTHYFRLLVLSQYPLAKNPTSWPYGRVQRLAADVWTSSRPGDETYRVEKIWKRCCMGNTPGDKYSSSNNRLPQQIHEITIDMSSHDATCPKFVRFECLSMLRAVFNTSSSLLHLIP